MGGGGGSSSPSYEAEYRWYSNPPRPYEGQNEINNEANRINSASDVLINGRIRPNESALRYYEYMNIYYMQLKDQMDAQTDWFLERYPDRVIERIVNIEKVFERINEYLSEENKNARQKLYDRIIEAFNNCTNLKALVFSFIARKNYYRDKMNKKREIETALETSANTYLTALINSMVGQTIQSIPNFEDYVSTNDKIYIGIPSS